MLNGNGLTGWCNLFPNYDGWDSPTTNSVKFGQSNQLIYFFLNRRFDNKEAFIKYMADKKVSLYYPV